MKKLRYGAMSVAIVFGVCAFFALREFVPLPAWASNDAGYRAYFGDKSALDEAIAARPDDFMTYYRRGVNYHLQQNFGAALADLNEAVRLSPIPLSAAAAGQGTHSRERRTLNRVFLVLTARAQVLLRMQRPQDALTDFDSALALDARRWDTYYHRAYAHLTVGNYDSAIADFNVLLERRAESQSYFGRGLSHYLAGDWAAARMDFDQAAIRAPSSETYTLWLTRAMLRGGVSLAYDHLAALQRNPVSWTYVQRLVSDEEPARASPVLVTSQPASAATICAQALLRGEWLSLRGRDSREAYSEALTNCAPLSLERLLAVAELHRAN